MINELHKLLFEEYLKENHKWFIALVGIGWFLIYGTGIASVVFIWLYPWWWKMALSTVAAWFLFRQVIKFLTNLLHKYFMSSKK